LRPGPESEIFRNKISFSFHTWISIVEFSGENFIALERMFLMAVSIIFGSAKISPLKA